MDSRQLSEADWKAAIAQISAALYDDNITIHPNRVGISLWAVDHKGKGARRSPSGRRLHNACWHVHRDVLRLLFERHPQAKIRTGLATYIGREGFERDYPATGSIMTTAGGRRTPFRSLCDCEDAEMTSRLMTIERELDDWESGPDAHRSA
jgi:hypothetical protein